MNKCAICKDELSASGKSILFDNFGLICHKCSENINNLSNQDESIRTNSYCYFEFIKKQHQLSEEIIDALDELESTSSPYDFKMSNYTQKNLIRELNRFGLSNETSVKTNKNSYTFQYIISFIIPLVGFIIGGIMITDKDNERQSVGKKCIILGIVSIILSVIFLCRK